MEKTPFLSIIIPTYNSEKTIKNSLESILNQTNRDLEVVIIDGLSEDNTLKIVEEYKNVLSLIILSEKDKGIYDAMNKGIDLAKGNWLYFMGSDDTFYEDIVLEKITTSNVLQKHDVIYGNVKIIGDSGWAKDGDIYAGIFTTNKLLNHNISHQAIFYKTNFVKEKIGYFDLAYDICSDWDFNLKCWSKTSFYYIEIIVSNFAAGGFSTYAISNQKFETDFLNNILKYFKIGLFNKLLNSTNFSGYSEVKKRQKSIHPYRYFFHNFGKRLTRKLKVIIHYFFKKRKQNLF